MSCLEPDLVLQAYDTVRTRDAGDLDARSLVSDRLPGASRAYRYRLRERQLWRQHFTDPIFHLSIRRAGRLLASFGACRFATEVSIDAADGGLFGFTAVLSGGLTHQQGSRATTVAADRFLMYRPQPGTRLLTSDGSSRHTVFLDAAQVEHALEHQLDDRLRVPLAFQSELDATSGLAVSLKQQIAFVVREFGRPDGVASNPAALASLDELLTTLVLQTVPHNYSSRFKTDRFGAVPAYLNRAEAFMEAHATEPIRMLDVAQAAGCSVRTLNAVFRQFRATTPQLSLRAIRLDQAHAALRSGACPGPIAAVARHFGFANAARFSAAFVRRHGVRPGEVRAVCV